MNTRRLPQKNRPARRKPDEAQSTARDAVRGVTTEGVAVDEVSIRLAALEMKTEAIAVQLIALQATLVALVPAIRIVDSDDVRDAMRSARCDAAEALDAARFPLETIDAVVREIDVLNAELLDRTGRSSIDRTASVLPC